METNLVSKILQSVLEAALPLLASAAVVWLTGKCVELFKKLQDKNPELYEILNTITLKAVRAAEQVWGSGNGQKKKEYAINVIEKYLAAKGIYLDLDIIEAAIEAEVGYRNSWNLLGENDEDEAEIENEEELLHKSYTDTDGNTICVD